MEAAADAAEGAGAAAAGGSGGGWAAAAAAAAAEERDGRRLGEVEPPADAVPGAGAFAAAAGGCAADVVVTLEPVMVGCAAAGGSGGFVLQMAVTAWKTPSLRNLSA